MSLKEFAGWQNVNNFLTRHDLYRAAGLNSEKGHFGDRLYLSFSNNVIFNNSDISLTAHILNGFASVITVVATGPLSGFHVFLTSSAGKVHILTNHRHVRDNMGAVMKLSSGQSCEENIPLIIGKDITPGEYTLMATRRFSTSHDRFELESNLLTVQVK